MSTILMGTTIEITYAKDLPFNVGDRFITAIEEDKSGELLCTEAGKTDPVHIPFNQCKIV